MLDHALTALQIAQGKTRDSLSTDPAVHYSLLHLVCILGEAANRVSDAGKAKYPHIPWRDAISMRNVLIHGYDIVDLDVLWATVVEDLPAFVGVLREALGVEADS